MHGEGVCRSVVETACTLFDPYLIKGDLLHPTAADVGSPVRKEGGVLDSHDDAGGTRMRATAAIAKELVAFPSTANQDLVTWLEKVQGHVSANAGARVHGKNRKVQVSQLVQLGQLSISLRK